MENSAIEWYKKATFEILKHKENLSDEMFLQNMLNAYLKAKELEKQQIIDAWNDVGTDGVTTAEEYYIKNFKSE
jgi:hypothetical protein